ncbi:hypothetical protein XaCFBP7622_14460 [Xanthomonas arboricola]|nr:hypothetical protein XaCFBP7622_14460 [Xanthomonas arboricola]
MEPIRHERTTHPTPLLPCAPTISTGPCLLTVAGPYAAWMPRKSLQGRTCGVSCDGGQARALHQRAASRARCPHRLRDTP